MNCPRSVFLWPCVLAAVWLGGCRLADGPSPDGQQSVRPWTMARGDSRRELYRRFQSEDPSVRMKAALQAGREKDTKSVPYLVDRLTDSEAEIRFVAVIALERITGTTRGYRYYEPPPKRDEAVQRWRSWLDGRAASQPAKGAEK
ncbi:MAG: HEAT repeat domain-containing protein [Phycisphaerae bacterium]